MPLFTAKQYVEVFHLLFLSQLGRKLDKKLYALKGGCNMRFYFKNIRYSEDMDIDIRIIAKDTLRKKIQQILNSTPFNHILQAKNIEILETSEPKQTTTTQRWKITLKILGSTLALNTKIEFSRREFGKQVLFEAIQPEILRQYSLPPILINHYSIKSMYEQKILALALRNQTQARDIFDLYFLIGSGIDLKLTEKKILQHLTTAKSNALSVSFKDFKGQVLAYLPEDYQAQYNDPYVWENILSTVTHQLDGHIHETH